jgi:hypothetical protein
MNGSRYDKVWRDWRAVAEGARSPAKAPRTEQRSRIPLGFAAAAVLIALAAVVSLRAANAPRSEPIAAASESVTPSSVASSSPSLGPTGEPSPSAAASATASRSVAPTSILTGTPRPGDEPAATAFVTQFETALAQQDFAGSWGMLAPEERAIQGSLDSWSAGTRLAQAQNGKSFRVGPASHDWQSWWEPQPDWLPNHYAGDYGRAFIFTVYDGSSAQNGSSVLMVLPSPSGVWEICILR